MNKICQYIDCKEPFETTCKRQIYCSRECKIKARNKRKWAGKKLMLQRAAGITITARHTPHTS